MNLNGLLVVNIELTSRCNKACWMCGRRKLEKLELTEWGDMPFELVETIAPQLPEGIIVQLHNNGEPTLYPDLGDVLHLLHKQITNFDTNGKLLLEKADEIIDRLDTLTISVIENDPEGDEQYQIVKKFLEIKKERKPFMIYRLLGDVRKYILKLDERLTRQEYDKAKESRWYDLPGLVATRILHNPMGSYEYENKVTVPEHGICVDLLSHLVIDRFGNAFPCVRFNPHKYNLLGNVKFLSLDEIWNSKIRKDLIKEHVKANRDCSKLCEQCDFWGCPTCQ